MNIIVTNDDGIQAGGLWALAGELAKIGKVMVVAPDREQSAIGTAVTLRQPLRVQKVAPLVPEVEAYSIDGTPSDSVILSLEKLAKGRVDMVVSGINRGLNLGEDVLISGTVGAAMQAYLRGFPALAISVAYASNQQHLDTAAKLAALLVKNIVADHRLTDIFLNVNLPDIPQADIAGVKTTRLASESHLNSIAEEEEGGQRYYRLVRQQAPKSLNNDTDISAVETGNISITPLYTRRFNKSLLPVLNKLSADLLQELSEG